MDIDLSEGYGIKVDTSTGKENPVSYHLESISDIFQMINQDNLDRFIKEFKIGLQVGINNRNLMKSMVEADGKAWSNDILDMPSFDWIDD